MPRGRRARRRGELDHVAIGRDPRANIGAKVVRTILDAAEPALRHARGFANAAKVRDVAGAARRRARREPEGLRADVHNVEHHLAHAASAFFVSPFDEAAVLSLDGFGDFASTMLAHGRGNRLEVLDRVLFPHSLGIFYTAVTQWLGFPKYGDEGKVMGLAPYGDPERFLPTMRELVQARRRPLRARARLLHAPQGRRRHDLGRADADDRPHLLRPDGARRSGRRASRAPSSTDGTTDVAAALQAMLEEAYLHLVRRCARAHRVDEPLPRRRRRAERGRERAHPAGDAVRGRLRPARGRRLRAPRSAPRTTSGTRSSASRGAS